MNDMFLKWARVEIDVRRAGSKSMVLAVAVRAVQGEDFEDIPVEQRHSAVALLSNIPS